MSQPSWIAVRQFTLAILDRCAWCGREMKPGQYWNVETRYGDWFCCSRQHAIWQGMQERDGPMWFHLRAVMKSLAISEDEYIDVFHLREHLLSEEEIKNVLEEQGG